MSETKDNIQQKKPIRIFVATVKNKVFTVPIMGNVPCEMCNGSGDLMGQECPGCKGKRIIWGRKPKLGINNQQQYIGNQPVWLEETYKFTSVRASHTHGFYSIFPIYEDTPQHIIDALTKMAEGDDIDDVWTEDRYEQKQNPEKYEEKQKRLQLEAENKTLKEKLEKGPDIEAVKAEVAAKYEDILAEMRAKVEQVESKATVPVSDEKLKKDKKGK